MLSDEAKKFLKDNYISNYTVNPDGVVDIDEWVKIKTKQSKFPVKFGRVSGFFDCNETRLTSLEGAPSLVNGNFYCVNNYLTSLEGAPSYVGGYFSCQDNQLTSLHYVHKHIKEITGGFHFYGNPINDSVLGLLMIKGLKGITFTNIKVEKILNQYLGQGRAGVISAQQELLDSGLDEFARL